jgi:hypothetical protein
MNALRPLFAKLPRTAVMAAGLSACALTAGCVGNPFKEAAVDPQSSVAADVQRISRGKQSFPSFRDIPAKSKDLRPIQLYGQEAHQLELARNRVTQATEPGTWTLQDTEGFASEARRRVGPDLPPPPPNTAEDTAKALRERATPPPPR